MSIVEKKIAALSVVAACLQCIKHNRNHSRVSNTKKEEMLDKTVAGYHGFTCVNQHVRNYVAERGTLIGPKSG